MHRQVLPGEHLDPDRPVALGSCPGEFTDQPWRIAGPAEPPTVEPGALDIAELHIDGPIVDLCAAPDHQLGQVLGMHGAQFLVGGLAAQAFGQNPRERIGGAEYLERL